VIKTKIAFRELSKAVTAEVSIESDELKEEELLKKTEELYLKASEFSIDRTMEKL